MARKPKNYRGDVQMSLFPEVPKESAGTGEYKEQLVITGKNQWKRVKVECGKSSQNNQLTRERRARRESTYMTAKNARGGK